MKQEARGIELGDMTSRHSCTSVSSMEVNQGLSSAHSPGEKREREKKGSSGKQYVLGMGNIFPCFESSGAILARPSCRDTCERGLIFRK